MTRLDWNVAGSRQFEAGLDRGVLYVGSDPGVPWIGLIAVNEDHDGGEPRPRYLDGIKITNGHTREEFKATIEAYTYPLEFEVCDGTRHIAHGLRATQQKRQSFGMSYRTKVGDELVGADRAYKIHILYNLLASPSARNTRTFSNAVDPLNFSWRVTSRAPVVEDIRPTAHFVVDSRDTTEELLTELEGILYGTEITAPRLLTAAELIFMFDSFEDLAYDAGDPYDPFFITMDAGTPATAVVTTIDGGTP